MIENHKIINRAFHPIEWRIVSKNLIGCSVLCAKSKEGLGNYAILIGVLPNSSEPYVCQIHNDDTSINVIRKYSWIGTTNNVSQQLSNFECKEIINKESHKRGLI
jgi:hypothetical protein